MTEQQGPFFIERNGNTVLVRSKQAFSWQITIHKPAERYGVLYVTEAIALTEGMTLILSTVGQDDIVIHPKGEGEV